MSSTRHVAAQPLHLIAVEAVLRSRARGAFAAFAAARSGSDPAPPPGRRPGRARSAARRGRRRRCRPGTGRAASAPPIAYVRPSAPRPSDPAAPSVSTTAPPLFAWSRAGHLGSVGGPGIDAEHRGRLGPVDLHQLRPAVQQRHQRGAVGVGGHPAAGVVGELGQLGEAGRGQPPRRSAGDDQPARPVVPARRTAPRGPGSTRPPGSARRTRTARSARRRPPR